MSAEAAGLTPLRSGSVVRAGVKLAWEEYGSGPHTVYLLPPWNLAHSRAWKLVLAAIAPSVRVVTSDPPGNGRSGPSSDPMRFSAEALCADIVAVLDATNTSRAVLVGHSRTCQALLMAAATRPDRVAGAVFLAPFLPYSRSLFPRVLTHPVLRPIFELPTALPLGWARMNARYISRHRRAFDLWFIRKVLSRPNSERAVDDAQSWAAQGDTSSLLASLRAPILRDRRVLDALAARVDVPVLVIHGTHDRATPFADGRWLAEATGGRLIALEGGDHCPHGRPALRTSLEVRDFAATVFGEARPRSAVSTRSAQRRADGRKRILVLSSPIGLGHARRDLAIIDALRGLRDDLDVQWLAQQPVTGVLERAGEHVHPASARLTSECRHFELESAGHELDAFRAFRTADALITHNFMVFRDLTASERFDLVIADEVWEADHYLHEHPEEKRAPFVWLTDFVGVLPMPDATEREARLAHDANALMVEHWTARPSVRDLALFVGNPRDAVDVPLGPGLPSVRRWAEQQFRFTGYAGARRYAGPDRDAARRGLGVPPGVPLCVVAVGGSGVGTALLERATQAHQLARRRVSDLHTVIVTGPRIPAEGPPAPGLERKGYVPDLDRVLAAADYAVVQGGLATAMELTTNGTPFAYVPLQRHFEQHFHVHHRLRNYRAGTRVDYPDATPDHLAALVERHIGQATDFRAVETDGHLRAASRIADLLN